MKKEILIRRVLVQVDNGKVYYTSAFDYKLMYTTQSADDLTRHQKIINMPQLMSLYKYIPNAEYSKTLFGKKDKIVDLSTNEYFDCTEKYYIFYNENNYVHIHKKLEIKIID